MLGKFSTSENKRETTIGVKNRLQHVVKEAIKILSVKLDDLSHIRITL